MRPFWDTQEGGAHVTMTKVEPWGENTIKLRGGPAGTGEERRTQLKFKKIALLCCTVPSGYVVAMVAMDHCPSPPLGNFNPTLKAYWTPGCSPTMDWEVLLVGIPLPP